MAASRVVLTEGRAVGVLNEVCSRSCVLYQRVDKGRRVEEEFTKIHWDFCWERKVENTFILLKEVV